MGMTRQSLSFCSQKMQFVYIDKLVAYLEQKPQSVPMSV
jgi:hypothetical protein